MIKKSHLKKSILDQAIAVAMASDAPKKMGAILLKRNKIISAAVNDYEKTHPVQYWAAQNAAKIFNDASLAKKQYLHAEIKALLKKREDADTIIVCRVGGHGKKYIRNARPCRLCSIYLIKNKIYNIHYSTDNGFVYENWEN